MKRLGFSKFSRFIRLFGVFRIARPHDAFDRILGSSGLDTSLEMVAEAGKLTTSSCG